LSQLLLSCPVFSLPCVFAPVINSLLPEPQASLLNGILFGTKMGMPRSLFQALIATGTRHIVALSGLNISILMALLAKMTLFLGRKISSLITIIFIFLFVVFVGASPSIVRAALMGSFSLLAIYFGKWNWGLLSLILSAIIMLLYKFSLIKDASFQLSFLATLGIILAGKGKECQRKENLLDQFIFLVKQNFRLTLSAQLFTLPIILFRFHRLSLIAPLANLLIEWVIQPIMVLGFLTAFSGLLWWPLGIIPAWLVWVPLTYLITIVECLAKVPGGSIIF